MPTLLENLNNTNDLLDNLSLRLDSFKNLFNDSQINLEKLNEKIIISDSITVKTIFQNSFCTLTLASFSEKDIIFPKHVHFESIEYLICTKGKFYMKFPPYGVRFFSEGECVKIPKGVYHSAIALEEKSEILAICIPIEKAYLLEK